MTLVQYQPETSDTVKSTRPRLASVTKGTRALPNRLLLYAREGWGKTSFAAHAPGVLFLLTEGEDGLEKLIETAQVDETAHFAEHAKTWADVLCAIDELIMQEHDHRVLAIDTINGVQQLLMRAVVAEHFAGNALKAAEFGGEQAGKVATIKLRELTSRIDRLRETKRMSVILLAHAQATKTPNPEGADFDRFTPALERKSVLPELSRWCDLILFGHVEMNVSKDSKLAKGKATGGTRRILKTEAEAWFDAKNRHGLTSEIDCGETAAEAWAAFAHAMKQGKGQ